MTEGTVTGVTAQPSEAGGVDAGTEGAGGPAVEVDWDELLEQLAARAPAEGWVTLEEAAAATGASRSTLRSWYRAGQIPAAMVPGPHGPQRLVPLAAVVDRALRSPRGRRQLEASRSLEAEVASLRRRVEALERHLGLG